MANQEKCFYCGKQFIPGSDLHGNRFGIKTSKFSVVHLVCSKKCENEFYSNERNKIQKEVDKSEGGGCLGSALLIMIVILSSIYSIHLFT